MSSGLAALTWVATRLAVRMKIRQISACILRVTWWSISTPVMTGLIPATGVVHTLSTVFVDNVRGVPVFTGSLHENTFAPSALPRNPVRGDKLPSEEKSRTYWAPWGLPQWRVWAEDGTRTSDPAALTAQATVPWSRTPFKLISNITWCQHLAERGPFKRLQVNCACRMLFFWTPALEVYEMERRKEFLLSC